MPGPVSDSNPGRTGQFLAPEDWKDPDPIPVDIAEAFAESFGLEQIVILGRRTGTEGSGVEHLMTYGKSDEHSAAADQIGQFLRAKVFGWEEEEGFALIRDRVRIARMAQRFLAFLRTVRDGSGYDYDELVALLKEADSTDAPHDGSHHDFDK